MFVVCTTFEYNHNITKYYIICNEYKCEHIGYLSIRICEIDWENTHWSNA